MDRNVTTSPAAFIRRRIADVSAYHVEPYPVEVILDANESPYPPPPALAGRLRKIMDDVAFNRYPDMNAHALRRAIAKMEGVDEAEILLGNGSDEIISYLIQATLDPGGWILTPTPTFSMYKHIAHCLNVETAEVPLLDDWSVDVDRTLKVIAEKKPGVIFLASPNNPTGACVSPSALTAIIESAPGLVIVDEAYVDFADSSVGPLFRKRPNVVILKTLSKAGFAALRLGYMMADRQLVNEVNKTRLPYNINSLTQALATEVVSGWSELLPLFSEIKKERERMFANLASIPFMKPYPSQANFILAQVNKDVETVFGSLLKNGVRVRWFKGSARLGDFFRITIGSPAENDRFINSLKSMT
ncbi:MAG: histidinol-phosphate transaminase [Nitrospinae bacterium]|nr:histidinol-phosphate transaminase [Nitrospinota bacterium]